MSITLTRIQVGIVGVQPGMVLLQTTKTNSQIQVAGFLNKAEQNSDVKVSPDDFVFANCSDGSEYYVVSATGTILTLIPAGGSVGGFEYVHTYWVAQNGSDSNSGKSIDSPFLTVSHAILQAIPGTVTVINIADGGVYGTQNFPANTTIVFNAPGASFTSLAPGSLFTSSGPCTVSGVVNNLTVTPGDNLFNFTTTPCTIDLDCNVITGNVNNATVASSITIKASSIVGNIVTSSSGKTKITCDTVIQGNVTDTGANTAASGMTGIFAQEVTGNVTSTNSRVYGNVPQVRGVVGYLAINGGFFQNNYYLDSTGVIGEAYTVCYDAAGGVWSFTPGVADGNQLIKVNDSFGGTINLPDASQFPDGWRIFTEQDSRSGSVQVNAFGADAFIGNTISPAPSIYTRAGIGQIVRGPLNGSGGYWWIATGDLNNNTFLAASPNVYVSQIMGSDTIGDGSIVNPYATIGKAVTVVGTPANATNIVVLDDQTYAENVVIAQPNINLLANQATIAPAAGDAVAITSTGATHYITVGNLSAVPPANALSNANNSIIYLNSDAIGQLTSKVTTNNGPVYIRASHILSDLETTGGAGRVFAQTPRFDGAVTGNSFAISPSGSTGTSFTVNALVAAGLIYPVADGVKNTALRTDGALNLSFGSISGGGLEFAAIAGTSQAAASNTAYEVQNALQTTITLPATPSKGDTVRIYGEGAGGWILQANAGQTIKFGAAASSVGGTFTSAAGTDCFEVAMMADGITWKGNWAVSAGLTPA